MDDKVIVVTRDANNHKHLTAYKIANADVLWSTGINDSLSSRLRLVDGKIYSTIKQKILCYNANNGDLEWQTDLNVSKSRMTATFFDKEKLILIKVADTDYTMITLDRNSGSVIKKSTLTVPTELDIVSRAPFGCNYYNNTLFITSRYNTDTVCVKSYDFTSLALRWEKRFPLYEFLSFVPLVTNRYLVFPISNSSPFSKSTMYFYTFDGKLVTGIPFSGRSSNNFAYVENGVVYKQDNKYNIGTE
jgi:hypothetical protein